MMRKRPAGAFGEGVLDCLPYLAMQQS
jgi:hypothetical protein